MSPISAWTMWCAGRARSQGLLRIDHLVSRARLERLIEQGDVPFITQPAARASDLDQIAGHAQGIMLRRVPRYARSIGANESRQLYRCRPQKNKGLPNAQNCEPGAAG